MRQKWLFVDLLCLLLIGCTTPQPSVQQVTFTESQEDLPNPERGFKLLTYFEHAPFTNAPTERLYHIQRRQSNITLQQHSYYLMDYLNRDVDQVYLDAFDANMQVLREAGCKCILRFAYSYNEDDPLDKVGANYQWVKRHVEQFKPYIQKNADVIFCMEAGYLGLWGEWGPSPDFPGYDGTEKSFMTRVELLDWLLDALPETRQIAVRTPYYKRMYLQIKNYPIQPIDPTIAHTSNPQARIAGHNDCFVSSANDYGTYLKDAERYFWQADTKYTVMGGEICQNCVYSDGERAIREMERYHFTYCDNGEWNDNRGKWKASGHWDAICQRMGYRLVMDKASILIDPSSHHLTVNLDLHNAGFAAPQNPRDVELILLNEDTTFTFKQYNIDPRFWLPENGTISLKFGADIASVPKGEYKLYLNLPDPCETLHDNPEFSIRCANEGTWNEKHGYNKLFTIELK